MSRCDYEGVFYRVFCVSLLIIAFTFTVILTNVFIDIDNLLNKKERGPVIDLGVTELTTVGNEATTEIQEYYIGVERNEGHYRSKRSLDSEQLFLRINNPKTKRYLTNRLAALLEALDDDEPENTTPKTDNGNIYIKTVKQKNNIEINELPPEGRDQMKVNGDVMELALHNMLQGAMGRLDMPELLNNLQSLVSNLKNRGENKNAGSVELSELATEIKNNLSEEQTATERLLKYSPGKKRDATLNYNDVKDTIDANIIIRKKKQSSEKNKNSKPVIRTVIDIKKDDENSMEDFHGIIKLLYNGKPIKIRTEVDSYETSTAIVTTPSAKPQTTTNSVKKDVEDFAGVMRDKFKNKHMPDAYIKTVMLEYLKNFASNDSSTSTTIVEKKNIRIKRNQDWSHEKQTEIPQTKDDDELFVEIETHFDKTGVKGEKKRKLVSSLIKKIQNAIRSSPDDARKSQEAPIKKRIQNRLDHGTVPDHIKTLHASPSYRELDPISKSMPIAAPLPLVSDQYGDSWKKPYQQPKFLSLSKSINSAEMNQLAVDYNQEPQYPVIPKRQQLPLSIDTSGENVNLNTVDVGKLQLLIKDIEGTGFSIGYNQYLDQAPDPESIKLFHGIEHIVNKYHEKHDLPDQSGNHENDYEMYGQEMKKREVKSETSLRTKRFLVNRNNDFKATVTKRKENPSVMNAYRKKRAVNLKTIINSNKKILVNKYINTNAFTRHGRYFKTKRSKRQINNIKVIDKTGQTSEDNNMFVVSDGDNYNDNLLVRHRQQPEVFFIDVVKPGKDHKPLFQPSNKPFSPHNFEIKNLNIYKNTPMFFENTGNKIVKLQKKKERNKRHTIKIYTRDMGHRDSSERSFTTEYDEANEDTYADRTVITQVDGPRFSTSDEEVKKVAIGHSIGHSRYSDVPIIYRNPFIVEENEHIRYENKNPTIFDNEHIRYEDKNPVIFDNDQHEFNLDPIRDQMRRNPLMSKYPHVFVEERTSGEEAKLKHIHRSIYPIPESKESDTSSDIERLYQAPNVQELVNAIAPPYRNNYKISVKLIPRDGNTTNDNFKEVHTSINKTFNKDGLLYSSLVNISEISKVDNYTNKCNHHFEPIPSQNFTEDMKPVQIPRGFENIAEYQRNIRTSTTQESINATTEATMQMNLMDIILPSSPRRVLHLTLADMGKLICDSMKSQNMNKSKKDQQIEQTRRYIPKITTMTTTTTTTTAMPTTMMTTEAVATTILEPERRIASSRKTRARNTQSMDPLKIKLLKAISMNEQLTSQILYRIDQNTGVLQTFLSKIVSEIEKLPKIANQAIKTNEQGDINNWNESSKKPDEYSNNHKAHTINVTKITPSAYSFPQKPPNIKPETLYNLNYIQTAIENNDRIIQSNTSDELKQMEHMKYFIDYDPKSTVPQSIVHNEPQRLIQDSLVNNGISKLNANRINNKKMEPSQMLNNMHSMMPVINNVIAQNNGTHYLS